MLEETPAGRLLRGARGRGPFDRDAAAEAIAAFSHFAQCAGDALKAVEVNPLIVLERGEGVLGVGRGGSKPERVRAAMSLPPSSLPPSAGPRTARPAAARPARECAEAPVR